jgi:methyl-accepting chemotaxis protein
MMIATRRICTPYVNTVLRMEALARGDTAAPITYTEYNECVGRMTKAMATFRDNAIEVQESREAQEIIVGELSDGLKRMAKNELDFELNKPFPGKYDELRRDFNEALASLSGAISSVRAAAARVLNGASEIRSASDDLAVRNEQQAASLEEQPAETSTPAARHAAGKHLDTAISFPAAKTRRVRPAPKDLPASHGNLALSSPGPLEDDEWSEF